MKIAKETMLRSRPDRSLGRRRVRATLRNALMRLGLEVRRADPTSTPAAMRNRILADRGVGLVLDLGASVGEYASLLRAAGYGGDIHSFEPQTGAYSVLVSRSRHDDRWFAHNAAVGSAPGAGTMYISANSVSSSLAAITDAHIDGDPRSSAIDTQNTEVTTLDTFATVLKASTPTFLKLDVQGFEQQALDGGKEMIAASVEAIEIELSLVELYEGQALLPEIWTLLTDLGFACVGLNSAFAHIRTGEVLQVDAMFVRKATNNGES